MLNKLLNKFFGNRSQRELAKFNPIVDEINSIFAGLAKLTDEQLRAQTTNFKLQTSKKIEPLKNEIEELEENIQNQTDERQKEKLTNQIKEAKQKLKAEKREVLEKLLPNVFALVKETCRRLLGREFEVRGNKTFWDMVPFDEQLIGAIALHRGAIAEMATGEGKTLVATMPLFLNALTGEGCHLVTVNDYLAQRDSEWMSPIFEFHGLSVSCITNNMPTQLRQQAYRADVVYGTNSEFGFDYLRDNMATSSDGVVQRGHNYAIVDEVDSVLIDEARTPLIISGAVADSKNFYRQLRAPIQSLVRRQEMLVKDIRREINSLKDDAKNEKEVGVLLLTLKRADPKGKIFRNFARDGSLKDLTTSTEDEFIRDKAMHKIDEKLYFAIDERAHSVDLCEMGQKQLSGDQQSLFVMKPLHDMLDEVEKQEDLSPAEKRAKKEQISSDFIDKSEKLHNIEQLLKAFMLYDVDDEYVIMEGRIVIVDEFTGRLMPGRRFSDGLHQALEAKHNLQVQAASQTFATITIQNYFKMYETLAGMTGTAITEEAEFLAIYKLPVMVIPTHLPISRVDYNDQIFLTKNEKYRAIISEIEYWHNKGKPVLVGTVSVDVSETLSRMLKRRKIAHNVLNAKQHQFEAEVIKSAGEGKSVTIATNMAGRGTDIKLGRGVVQAQRQSYLSADYKQKVSKEFPFGKMSDGLHVIGTERHEARRIDRQLRGRSGRQGDPGTSRFYLSLEDDLMRLFGSGKIAPMMKKLGLAKGEAIEHNLMTKAVERAQKRVEGYNFQVRKNLIEYDLVMNSQREVIYSWRMKVLGGYSMKSEVLDFIDDVVHNTCDTFLDEKNSGEIEKQLGDVLAWMESELGFSIAQRDFEEKDLYNFDTIYQKLKQIVLARYKHREAELGSDVQRELERFAILQSVDTLWREHLHEMDFLKEGIGLRAYGQRDPLIEYKKESFTLFEKLIESIATSVVKMVFIFNVVKTQVEQTPTNLSTTHSGVSAFKTGEVTGQSQNNSGKNQPKKQPLKVEKKVGRNEPCPCGSGKKFKKCHGRVQ